MPKGQQIDEIVPDLVTQSGKSFRKLKSKVEKPEIKRIKQSQFDLKIKFYEFSQQALYSLMALFVASFAFSVSKKHWSR